MVISFFISNIEIYLIQRITEFGGYKTIPEFGYVSDISGWELFLPNFNR